MPRPAYISDLRLGRTSCDQNHIWQRKLGIRSDAELIIEVVRQILSPRSLGVFSVLLLACAPAFWKVLAVGTLNVPVDVVWIKSFANVVTYLVLAAASTGIAGLMRDKKKAVAGSRCY